MWVFLQGLISIEALSLRLFFAYEFGIQMGNCAADAGSRQKMLIFFLLKY